MWIFLLKAPMNVGFSLTLLLVLPLHIRHLKMSHPCPNCEVLSVQTQRHMLNFESNGTFHRFEFKHVCLIILIFPFPVSLLSRANSFLKKRCALWRIPFIILWYTEYEVCILFVYIIAMDSLSCCYMMNGLQSYHLTYQNAKEYRMLLYNYCMVSEPGRFITNTESSSVTFKSVKCVGETQCILYKHILRATQIAHTEIKAGFQA